MRQGTPPQAAITPARIEWINLLDLPYWLDRRGLRITHTRIVGEFDGKLWIEAETQANTTSDDEVITNNDGEDSSRPRHDSPQSQKDGGESRRGGIS